MNTHFFNIVSYMDLGPQTPIAPNLSINKTKKKNIHFLSLG